MKGLYLLIVSLAKTLKILCNFLIKYSFMLVANVVRRDIVVVNDELRQIPEGRHDSLPR